MKLKNFSILVVLVIAMILPTACNADGGKKAGKGSEAVNSDNPGEEMDVSKVLIKGKINIVDFYSEYCPPCRRIAPILAKLDKKRDDLVVIKVDINRPGHKGIDWKSPLAVQYGLRSIPHFKIFDENGEKIAEGIEAQQKVGAYLSESNIQLK